MAHVELAACQVRITADDYASQLAFEAMLARTGRLLDAARARDDRGGFRSPCLAVFPEMIGAFLPLVDRASLARGARTTDAALTRVALASLPSIASVMADHFLGSPKVAFLVASAPEVWRYYRGAFSRFARAHDCWVVAGSALLPRNVYGDLADRFEAADGRVYNTSFAFSPAGDHVRTTRKVNLVPTLEDTLGLTPGRADELTPFEAPFGKVGTLVCYDGFGVAHTDAEPDFHALAARCDAEGCAVIAQPAANPWPWEGAWTFGSRGRDKLRRQQWLDEGLFAQLDAGRFTNLRYAVTAQLVGRIFDNQFDGRSHILEHRKDGARVLAEAPSSDAAEVVMATVDLPV